MYNYLLTEQLPLIQPEYFADLVFLASLLNYLSQQIKYLPQRTIDDCEECLEVPEIREALLDYYLRKTTFFTARAPRWVKQDFLARETKELPEENDEPLYLLLSQEGGLFFPSSRTGGDERYVQRQKSKDKTAKRVLSSQLSKQTNLFLSEKKFYSCADNRRLRRSEDGLWCASYGGEDDEIRSYKAPMVLTFTFLENLKAIMSTLQITIWFPVEWSSILNILILRVNIFLTSQRLIEVAFLDVEVYLLVVLSCKRQRCWDLV